LKILQRERERERERKRERMNFISLNFIAFSAMFKYKINNTKYEKQEISL